MARKDNQTVISRNLEVTELLVLPRYTTAERDALTGVKDGTPIYNTTTNKMNIRANGAWEAVTSA